MVTSISIYLSVVNTDQCQKIIWNHLPTVVKRMWRWRQSLSIKSRNHLSVVWMLRSKHDLSVKIWNHLSVVSMAIKVLLWSNSRYPFFTFSYTTGLSKISCQISIYYEQYNSCFLDLYFREFTAAINFPCSKSWLRIGENDVIFSKIPHGFKFRAENNGRLVAGQDDRPNQC